MPSELQHWVTLTQPFYIATTTVTQAQWKAVIGADPSHFKGDDLPVECVSWNDALRFCKKLSEMEGKKYRLPTEAEWECCCRAGAQTPFYTGSTITTDQANYNGNYVYGNGPKGTFRQKTTPVGVFKPNAWGLFDMHANVREWCWDGFDEFEKLNDDDAVDPAGADWSLMRVQRGGSWNDPPYGRSAGRSFYKADETSNEAGFRVCLEFERFSGNSK